MADLILTIAGIVIGTDLIAFGIVLMVDRRSRAREHPNPVPPLAR